MCGRVFKTHTLRWHHTRICSTSLWIPPQISDPNERIITVNNMIVKTITTGLFPEFFFFLIYFISDLSTSESHSDLETIIFNNFHLSEETYSRYDRRRKTTLLESDKKLFHRCPKNHKSLWGFDFNDIQPLLSEAEKQQYPWNWIGLNLKESEKLTTTFLENHYFRRQEHNDTQYTVSSAIKWVIKKSKPEYFAQSTAQLSSIYDIDSSKIQYDKPIATNIPRFPQIAYLENPGQVIREFYLAAVKEKRQNIILKPIRTRRRYTTTTRLPTMKRLQQLLEELCEDPNINHEIFGYRKKLYLDNSSSLSEDESDTFDDDNNEPSVVGHWWSIFDIFKKHLTSVISLKILEFVRESKSIILPFKIWMDGTSTGTHSIIKVTASLIFDSTQFKNSLDSTEIDHIKEFSSIFSRIFNWILLPLPESKFAYKEVGKILRKDLLSLMNPISFENKNENIPDIYIRPLLLSSDAKAARIASGVSGGGIYRCQMCYIQQKQIPDFSVACRMLLRHWRRTAERVSSNEKIPLGDVAIPIWMKNSDTYDPKRHGTEYFTVLVCVMHVIEGWSAILWQAILPNFKNKKNLVKVLQKDIVGLIDSKKLLNCTRIPCHCWRDIFSHPLLQDRYIS